MGKWLIIRSRKRQKKFWCHTGIFTLLHGSQPKRTTATEKQKAESTSFFLNIWRIFASTNLKRAVLELAEKYILALSDKLSINK